MRLEALVKTTNTEFIKNLDPLWQETEGISPAELQSVFMRVVEPQVPANSGIRFGLYIPGIEKITVLGFLHNYRNLSPEEETQREKEIFISTKTGLLAAQMGDEPLFRISGTWNDQIVEYISPVILKGNLVAVMWAGERLNPFFYESSYFGKLLRYFTLGILAFVMICSLVIIGNLTKGVNRLKQGLQNMEKDIHQPLPEMSGELGQVTQAVNRMAVALTEKERLEDQLRQSEHLIALGRLATGVAHELRNPIGIIKTLVDLMKQEYSQVSGIEEFTKAIDEQIERQEVEIQELLDFGRPTKVSMKECSVNDLIKGVLTFSSAMLRKQKIIVDLRLSDTIPHILADAEKLKQVFVNIIVNAAEAMPEGGQLIISTEAKNNTLAISFSDTGEGIPAEETSRIFDPFYTTKKTGTGLGLSISYQYIQLHHGNIEVNSIPHRGTTFVINLPLN